MRKSNKRYVAGAAALGIASLLLSACSSGASAGSSASSSSGSITIGISSEGQSLPYVAAIVSGMQKEAKARGAKVVLTDAQLSTTKQTSDIQDLIEQKPAGIIILPLDGVVGQGQVNSIVQAGIPVVAAGSEIGDPTKRAETDAYPKLVALVAQNEKDVGLQAGQLVKQTLPGGGDLGVILGAPGYAENTLRLAKFPVDAPASKYPVVATQPGQWTPDAAQTACQNIITSNPSIKMFYTLSDDMAVGCNKALQAAQSTAKIVGVGGYPDVLSIMKSSQPSNIVGTVCFNPILMGKLAVDALVDHIQGKSKKMGQFISYPTIPVTKSNLSKCVPGYK